MSTKNLLLGQILKKIKSAARWRVSARFCGPSAVKESGAAAGYIRGCGPDSFYPAVWPAGPSDLRAKYVYQKCLARRLIKSAGHMLISDYVGPQSSPLLRARLVLTHRLARNFSQAVGHIFFVLKFGPQLNTVCGPTALCTALWPTCSFNPLH